MPQMAPMAWLNIMILTLLVLMLVTQMIYFSCPFPSKHECLSSFTGSKKMKLTW